MMLQNLFGIQKFTTDSVQSIFIILIFSDGHTGSMKCLDRAMQLAPPKWIAKEFLSSTMCYNLKTTLSQQGIRPMAIFVR